MAANPSSGGMKPWFGEIRDTDGDRRRARTVVGILLWHTKSWRLEWGSKRIQAYGCRRSDIGRDGWCSLQNARVGPAQIGAVEGCWQGSRRWYQNVEGCQAGTGPLGCSDEIPVGGMGGSRFKWRLFTGMVGTTGATAIETQHSRATFPSAHANWCSMPPPMKI